MNDTTSPEHDVRYSIGELAELGGVSRRTVRYYVQRELLPAPHGTGRGAHYTTEHLDRLVRIRELQERGTPLDDIGAILDGRPAPPPATPIGAPRLTPWMRIELADGVELSLRDRRVTSAQAAAIAAAVRDVLGGDAGSDDDTRAAGRRGGSDDQ